MTIQGESARERSDYTDRVRRQNVRLAFGVAAFLALTAALPVTRDDDRAGVLVCALSVLVLCVVWFRIVPARAFGESRVLVFGVLAQPSVIILPASPAGSGPNTSRSRCCS